MEVEFMQKYSKCFWRIENLLCVALFSFWKGPRKNWGIGDDQHTSVVKKDKDFLPQTR